MSLSYSHDWISHVLYNQLPSVENARILLDTDSQITVNKKLAIVVPDLLGKIGTTLTHSHWLTEKNESVIGIVEGEKISSEPRKRTQTTCPTSWVAIGTDLLATEGIDNPSKEVIEIAKKVQNNASKIIPQLPLYPNQKFSNLSITIDPRISFQTDKRYFVERNRQGKSIITPAEKKELEFVKKIVTFISVDLPQNEGVPTEINDKNLGQQFCIQECEVDIGDGYHERSHKS